MFIFSWGTAGLLWGQEPGVRPEPVEGAREGDTPDDFIPDAPSIWTQTLNGRASVGYNDNLLLDTPRSEQSLALGAGVDASLGRLPLDGRQLLFYVSGDYTYYPMGVKVDHEALALGLTQLRLDVSPNWQAALELQYIYLDQVIDTSVTENTLSATPVRAHSALVQPSVRRTLPRGFWVEGLVGVSRQWLAAPFDHYWEGGPKLAFGLDYGVRSSLIASYEWKPRAYDTREEVSLSGTNLPGTKLKFQVHELELAWRHDWDEQRRWRTFTKLEMLVNRDSGPGYFDYQRYQLSEQLRYVSKQWEARLQVRLTHYDFVNQEAGNGDTDRRIKDLAGFSLRGERRLTKYIRLFADYSYEESLSNRTTDEYRVNKVAGGVDCGF